jgi:hypothetical protein
MHAIVIYRNLAERWQEAAREATSAALGACYARRAERYLELAAAEANRPVRSAEPAQQTSPKSGRAPTSVCKA